ncbi:hypothetical protein CRM22_007944 [Opisthorchis felineus]|uniref:Uncharacterized protein n=1 Tax=Opisthorchis felineus TaxID=147828 RepID=A0A4S2LE70_OPIFE|nr:hypothetical protein CRM22_007944 [Opisthorchis felineus]
MVPKILLDGNNRLVDERASCSHRCFNTMRLLCEFAQGGTPGAGTSKAVTGIAGTEDWRIWRRSAISAPPSTSAQLDCNYPTLFGYPVGTVHDLNRAEWCSGVYGSFLWWIWSSLHGKQQSTPVNLPVSVVDCVHCSWKIF